MAETFEDIARDWRALLRSEAAAAFALERLPVSVRLAAALLSEQDVEAAAVAVSVCCRSEADEQLLLAQVAVLRRLLEAILREHMSFLLSELEEDAADPDASSSATRRAELSRRQAIVASLPPAFRQPFRVQLRENWEALQTGVTTAKLSLPRLEGFHWAVTDSDSSPALQQPQQQQQQQQQQKTIVVRLQTSDGVTRKLQLPLRQFHRLRHSAATVLQEMNQVEAHPMMRLVHMEQARVGAKETHTSAREVRIATAGVAVAVAASEAP